MKLCYAGPLSAPRSVVHWCNQARIQVGPGVPRAPQTVATGRHWPRSTLPRILFHGAPRRRQDQEGTMHLLYQRCCGLDVHKDTVVACLRLASDGKVTTEVRTFKTTTAALLQLSAWLAANSCTHVAMEATGVYWKPVWHILDDGEFELVLANAAHVKNVPGRKTDVNDAMWLAELLAHGLIRSSFVPDTQTQEMRGLLRTRKQLIREQSSHMLRVQKTLARLCPIHAAWASASSMRFQIWLGISMLSRCGRDMKEI